MSGLFISSPQPLTAVSSTERHWPSDTAPLFGKPRSRPPIPRTSDSRASSSRPMRFSCTPFRSSATNNKEIGRDTRRAPRCERLSNRLGRGRSGTTIQKSRNWPRACWDSCQLASPLQSTQLILRHLVEAVWVYQISQYRIHQLSRRSKELSSPTASHPLTGPSPVSNTSSPPAATGPSPAAQSSSSSSADPPNSATNPTADIQNLIRNVSNLSSSATTHLQTSRHYLPLSLLRARFPKTFDRAISSDLGDEALPAPGDTLGNARNVDIDDPEAKWAWPIELGMCCPLAHVTAFGRSLVEELAESQGWAWDRKWAP